jgi:LCP family protein required for cell wall assembly
MIVRRRPQKLRRSSTTAQKLFTAFLVILFVAIAITAGRLVFDQVRQSIASSTILPDFTIKQDEPSDVVHYEKGQPLPRWKGTDRVNILVMGIDQREFEQGPWRTDTMLVLTVDPVTMNAGVLSIPRDLWVPMADYDEHARINQAHFLGEVYDYPGGGPALAAKTVQYNLGVPIHYYVRINFTAFEELVDAIGGVTICVEEEINDPTYPDEGYGYDPLYIPAGCQELDGEMTLKYARTRHSAGGDFDRAKRQQQVVRAVFDKVTQAEMLPELASNSNEMWETLQGSVLTDLKLDEMIALAQLSSEVDPDSIRYGVIDENYTLFWTTPDGQQVLVPVRERIRELRDRIFTNDPVIPETEDDPAERLQAEAATIQILNGTTTVGLAGNTQAFLAEQGLPVTQDDVGNADHSSYTHSKIAVHTEKTFTAEHLAQILGLPPSAVVHEPNAAAEYDITVILGSDFKLPVPSE